MNDRDLIFEQYKLIKEEEEKPVMTVSPRGNREWRLSNGLFHRRDGPAIENDNGFKEWLINGKTHREDGPAIEFPDGYKAWWVNNKRHRLDGPAVEWADGTKQWWVNDELHREDGPAIERADGSKEWYLSHNLFPLTPEEWAEEVLKLHKKPHDKESIEEFLRDIYAKNAEDLL